MTNSNRRRRQNTVSSNGEMRKNQDGIVDNDVRDGCAVLGITQSLKSMGVVPNMLQTMQTNTRPIDRTNKRQY